MLARRAVGNRVVHPLPAPPFPRGRYLVAHACFACRKSWKMDPDRAAKCPECGGPAHSMGRAFKAPRQANVAQWKKVERLWRAGFRFAPTTGSREASPYPDRLWEVERFIAFYGKKPQR